MNQTQPDLSLQMLDQLARLDPARRDLQQEIDRALAGQEEEVDRAYWRLLKALEGVGLRVFDEAR